VKQGITLKDLEQKIDSINQILLDERSHRVRPGLDDKCLTSWNAMLLKGFSDAYAATGEEEFLIGAGRIARWIKNYQLKDARLWRTRKNGQSTIEGFLEDYAHVINAFISYYQITFESEWLNLALLLCETVDKEFYDVQSGMCFYTSKDSSLIARKMELNDNVIPASNSVMAHNYFQLGELFYRKDLKKKASQMLANLYDGMEQYGSGYSNWALLLMDHVHTKYLAVITGDQLENNRMELASKYLPDVMLAGGTDRNLPMLADKEISTENRIYVCYEGTCLLPAKNIDEVTKLVASKE
jgi:uncharacterized protein YyaL (SSP411 family)